jgi:hypothetical protein
VVAAKGKGKGKEKEKEKASEPMLKRKLDVSSSSAMKPKKVRLLVSGPSSGTRISMGLSIVEGQEAGSSSPQEANERASGMTITTRVDVDMQVGLTTSRVDAVVQVGPTTTQVDVAVQVDLEETANVQSVREEMMDGKCCI